MTKVRGGWAARAAVLAVAAAGCSSDKTAQQIAAMNTSNAQRLANLYAGHQNGKGGAGPKDEAAFRKFIAEYDPGKLSAMGVNPDAVFTSERDGKPFKVKYGVGGGRGSVAPVVFEQEGQNGKRQVGFTGGTVEEVDASRYDELWKGKAPAGGGSGPPTGGPPAGGRPTGAPTGAPTGPPK